MRETLPSDIFKPGQVLNNTYEVMGVLGRGGTGEVYQARNRITGRVFAMKALKREFSGDADYIELMKREEQIRNVSHPSVVRYNECFQTEHEHVVLVMDYIEGRSLSEDMASRQMRPKELLIVGLRIAEALRAAHGYDIVHRDISPDNIILESGVPERAKLIDFGIAKDTGQGARTIVGNQFAGKYEYAAPEQLDGTADGRSDFYALGATLLAAYRGEEPFLGTTPGEIVRRKANPLDLDGVPEPLRTVVATLTAPRPDERPADADEVVTLMERHLEPVGGGRRKRPGRKREKSAGGGGGVVRWGAVAAGVAALAVVVAAALWFLLPTGAPSLPHVAPYMLSASLGPDGTATLDGHAPDQEARARIARAFGAAAGVEPSEDSLTLASGAPDPAWPADLALAFERLAELDWWRMNVTDRSVAIEGLAADGATTRAVLARLEDWATASAFETAFEILSGPEQLSATDILDATAQYLTCGDLEIEPASAEIPLGATVSVRGKVADRSDGDRLGAMLPDVLGSRALDMSLEVERRTECSVGRFLPPVGHLGMELTITDGDTERPRPDAVFGDGENPIVDLFLPADTEGYLTAAVVTNDDMIVNILPDHRSNGALSRLGEVEGTRRRLTLLHDTDVTRADPSKLSLTMDGSTPGRSEIVVLLSRRPLFDPRRPLEESAAAFGSALNDALQGDPSNLIGVRRQPLVVR